MDGVEIFCVMQSFVFLRFQIQFLTESKSKEAESFKSALRNEGTAKIQGQLEKYIQALKDGNLFFNF